MLTVTTNWQPRPIIDAFELSEKERKEFDYIDWAAIDRGEGSASFFRYRGQLYDLEDIPSTRPGPFSSCSLGLDAKYWHGFAADSFFSGIAVHLIPNDPDMVIVGLVFAE
jgi:hypothetical protein